MVTKFNDDAAAAAAQAAISDGSRPEMAAQRLVMVDIGSQLTPLTTIEGKRLPPQRKSRKKAGIHKSSRGEGPPTSPAHSRRWPVFSKRPPPLRGTIYNLVYEAINPFNIVVSMQNGVYQMRFQHRLEQKAKPKS